MPNLDDFFDPSSPDYNGAINLSDPPGAVNVFTGQNDPASLSAGELQGNTTITDGYLQSENYVPATTGWRLTPTSGDLNFAVSVDSLDIPDTTTAASVHIKTDGTVFGGANNASEASALWNITPAGQATFKNILIGGASIQYQVTNAGIFSFGDGSDGAGVADGVTALAGASLAGSTYTLTRDVYYTDLTVSTGVIIKPAGYRIFGSGTLTLNGTALIHRNGNAGGNGGDFSSHHAGAAGAALADGYLKGSQAGGVGGIANRSAPTAAGNGTNTTNSIGSSASASGDGGTGDNGGTSNEPGGTKGTAGTATASNVKLIANWHLATLLDIGSTGASVKFDNSASPGGGGYGGRGLSVGVDGGDGGGGGSAGGIVAIYFRVIVIGASASITANGGAGGNGGDGFNNGANDRGGGGGGGAGGNGGQVILVYNSLTNSGTLSAAGGTKGTGGTTAGNNADNGHDGTDGAAGTIRQFQVSL